MNIETNIEHLKRIVETDKELLEEMKRARRPFLRAARYLAKIVVFPFCLLWLTLFRFGHPQEASDHLQPWLNK